MSNFGEHDTGFRDVIVETSKFTVKARQLNESLYELHRPQGLPTAQVLFFHGFQRHYENPHLLTWTAGDESGLWPQTWLVKKFPGAHILSVSYYGGKLLEILKQFGDGVDVDMYLVVENLLSDLLDAEIGCDPRCPVILVGHSFGCLVVKQLCMKACNQLFSAQQDPRTIKLREFVDNLKGVFFYGTPHRGIQDNSLRLVNPDLLKTTGPLLEYVKVLGKSEARLHEDFDKLWRNHKDWRIAGLGESIPTKLYGRPANFQHLPESVVGINNVRENAMRMLKETPRLCFVGIRGVGKTTMAMALFNEMEVYFEYTCFIHEVKDLQGSKDGKMKVAMLERLHRGGRLWTAENTDLNFLRGKRLLLVLDDVSSERDLDIVHILDDLVHEDSRFIATSRDTKPFKQYFEVYSGLGLDPVSSRKLFLSHAFPNDSILNKTFEKFVVDIVPKCGGLPLSLTVLGKYLRGEKEQIWKETFNALENGNQGSRLGEDLWAIPKRSDDGRKSKEEKSMLSMDDEDMDHNNIVDFKEDSSGMTQDHRAQPGWSPNAEPLTLLQEEPDPITPETMEATEAPALESREDPLHGNAFWKGALHVAGAMAMVSVFILLHRKR